METEFPMDMRVYMCTEGGLYKSDPNDPLNPIIFGNADILTHSIQATKWQISIDAKQILAGGAGWF